MRLNELLKGVKVISSKISVDTEIEKPCSDSRKCIKNSVFIAINGENRDGNEYIDEALKNGAICIVTDKKDVYIKHKNCILVKNSRSASAYMWSNYYKFSSSNMKIIGITGTNGKTSCAYFLYNILKKAHKRVGLISTIECLINDKRLEINGGGEVLDIASAMTTPDPEILYYIFSKMRENDIEFVVMEVSSHALELRKVEPIDFSCAIFTNLSSEHLDFHKNMESYFNSKKRLFEKSSVAIVNTDDEYGKQLLAGGVCDFCTVSSLLQGDFCIEKADASMKGTTYLLKNAQKEVEVYTKIIGKYNIFNSALAFACATILGIKENDALEGIASLNCIPGRMESLGEGVFVDYAHTPKAFENVLGSLRDFAHHGRIIALFGCGGDRDKSKRPEMGKIASKLADKVIITSDNSRTENKMDIISDIVSGIEGENFEIVISRKDAIKRALEIKKENDIVLLLGKGHEKYEIDSEGKHYFSEKDIVREVLYDKNNPYNHI
jgi:UDP-N-acetylmuramoyl-L-alanyl-D-glutamate--2,6-diaminopimelate ligase